MFGWGRLTFLTEDESTIALSLKYELHADGFRFVVLSDSTPRDTTQSYSEIYPLLSQLPVSAGSSSPKYTGSAVLAGLPASPAAAFYNLTLTYQADQLSLTIASPPGELFAKSPRESIAFKNLQLTFTQATTSSELGLSGTVVATVLGVDLELTASFVGTGSDRQLTFTQSSNASTSVPISPWGMLDISTLTVQATPINWDELQTLYTFDEGRGDRIFDCAASDRPIDMTIETPDAVTWGAGHISLDGQSLISSGDDDGNPDRSGDQSSAARLIAACNDSGELTIAAWIQPTVAEQKGPARIVALSRNTGDRHFMLGHGIQSGSGTEIDRYKARFKTSRDSGTEGILSTENSVTTDLTYLAYTHDANLEDDDNAKLYLDGFFDSGDEIKGNLEDRPWSESSSYQLVMGNVPTGLRSSSDDRRWLGLLHRIAIYSRALTAEEIYQQYYPTVLAEGTFRLNNPPNPLDIGFPATLSLEANGNGSLQLQVNYPAQGPSGQATDALTVTPQFSFTSLDWLFYQDLDDESQAFIFDEGEMQGQLWGNAIAFAVSTDETEATDQGLKLVLQSPPVDLELARTGDMLSDIDIKLDGLNTLTFDRIVVESLVPPDTASVAWQITSFTRMQEVLLPRLKDGRPFDWTVDFKLLNPALAIEDGKVKLTGTWLEQDLSLYGEWRDGQFVMRGDRTFSLPFSLNLGPIFAPGTTELIVDSAAIDSVMETTLNLELTNLGFLAQATSTFTWTDKENTTHTFTVPTFTTSQPPLTANQILTAVLDQLTTNAGEIFAEQFSHTQDYFFDVVGAMPLIYLGDRAATAAQAANPQTLILPQLFTSVDAKNSFSEGAFSLTQAATGCSLDITPTGATSSDLATLETDYAAFLTKLESETVGLIPGAINGVKTRVAERLPMTVDRILYHYYGLDTTNGAVDLQGGMRLRVDYQNYQFVHPSDKSANTGFVSSGSAYYYFNSSLAPTSDGGVSSQFSFDPFLRMVQPFVAPNIAALGASSIIDVFGAGYEQSYYRLLYPSQVNEVAGQGSERVATLVGAPTLAALNQATTDFQNSGSIATTSTNIAVFHFRGRATVIPEIAVFVQGQPVFVPLGTTLRQLCEQSVSVPVALPSQSLPSYIGMPRLSRILHEGVSSQPSYRFVTLDARMHDLPLVKGDRIAF
ncbi:MAG: LamG domain-containing protein [Cyanobacteria bacterium P01_F01_bin.150]